MAIKAAFFTQNSFLIPFFRVLTLLSLIPWVIIRIFMVMLYDAGSSMSQADVAFADGIVFVWNLYPLICLATFVLSIYYSRHGQSRRALYLSATPVVLNLIPPILFVFFPF